MKNILLVLLIICITTTSEAVTNEDRAKEISKLTGQVDSLTMVINTLSNNIRSINGMQEMLSVRMTETREDYMTYLSDLHETRNWMLGVISLIVGAFGVAFPIISNHQAKKKSEKALSAVNVLNRNIDDINVGIMKTKDRIDTVAGQIDNDREIINTQLSDIKTIKEQIDKIQNKIKASENSARESQQRAMISSLFSQAINEKDKSRKIELYTRILKLDPQNAEALNNRSIAYSNTKQYKLALQDAEQYIKLKPESPNGYAIIGLVCLEQKDYLKAVEYSKEAISKDPQDMRGYRLLSSIYVDNGQSQNLIDILNVIAQKDRLTASDYNNRAYAYYKLGKLDIALADVNESLLIDDKNAEVYDTRACIYIAMGPERYELALNDLNNAIALKPNLWESYENRASLYQKMIEATQDPERKKLYKQLRFTDLEIFRKRNTQANEPATDPA